MKLTLPQLSEVVSSLAKRLDEEKIEYAIMGGAAVILITGASTRQTDDVDLVIHVDKRKISADSLTSLLCDKYPADFVRVSQFGHAIPACRLKVTGGGERHVELEVFDHQSWPGRPQYNLEHSRSVALNVNGRKVKLFSAAWLLREKILSAFQRKGSSKEAVDVNDLKLLLPSVAANQPELDFDHDKELQTALSDVVKKHSELFAPLKSRIKCAAVFGHQ